MSAIKRRPKNEDYIEKGNVRMLYSIAEIMTRTSRHQSSMGFNQTFQSSGSRLDKSYTKFPRVQLEQIIQKNNKLNVNSSNLSIQSRREDNW